MSTKTKEPIRVPEEDQGAINPLAGVFEVSTKKELKINGERVRFEAICTTGEDGEKAIALEVRTNEHYAGEIFFDPVENHWYHLGLKQTKLDGKDSADRVGASKNFIQALKNLLKARYPQEFKNAVA